MESLSERIGPRVFALFLDPRTLARACASQTAFEAAFGTEEKCRRFWIESRWPRGFECPRCLSGGRWDAKRRGFTCRRCRKFTSLTAGTRLQGTRKTLGKWFEAIYLMVQRGVSARTLQRELGLTYKAAWTWGHKLRSLLGPVAVPPDLRPPREKRHERYDAERRRLTPLSPSCGCVKLEKRDWGWPDEIAEEREATRLLRRQRDGVHWSRLWPSEMPPADEPRKSDNRAGYELLATYYGSLSEKHLRGYLDEVAFRWNRRHRPIEEGFDLLARAVLEAEPRTYKQIIAKPAPTGHPLSIFNTIQRPRQPRTARVSAREADGA